MNCAFWVFPSEELLHAAITIPYSGQVLSRFLNFVVSDSNTTQAAFLVSRGQDIDVSLAAILFVPVFLASTTGAQSAMSNVLLKKHGDITFEKAAKLTLENPKLEELPQFSFKSIGQIY